MKLKRRLGRKVFDKIVKKLLAIEVGGDGGVGIFFSPSSTISNSGTASIFSDRFNMNFVINSSEGLGVDEIVGGKGIVDNGSVLTLKPLKGFDVGRGDGGNGGEEA